ncbi:unnamed protein product, partial [Effrenium voratum]
MASIPESSAVFLERCAAVGLGESETTILQNAGITTLAKLAFSVGQPGETPSTDDLKGLIREGDEAVSVGQLSCIRRLVFEAQTIMIAQVKSLVENKPEGSLQLAPAERSERIKKQVERLKGLTLKGELECAHSCYDQDKPRREIILVSGSQLQVHEKPSGLTCDTGSELLLAQALTRRGLAMDLMQLATYAVVEEYNSMLLNHLQSHAIPGYNKVTLQQVLKADQQAWVRLAETLTSGVKRAADGSLPMDAAIQALANDPKFTFYLLPLPLASQKRSLEDAAERRRQREEDEGMEAAEGHAAGADIETIQYEVGAANLLGVQFGLRVLEGEGSADMNSFTERAAARFDGKFLNDVFFIEVFCGTSRLTACVRAGPCMRWGAFGAAMRDKFASWMWETSFWLDSVGATTFYETYCHHCMYGSNRKKWTKFVHNFVELSGVSALCDGTHEHLPWGYSHDGNFSTSEETAYPWKLCKALSHAYAAAWFAYGAIGAPLELEAVVNQHELQLAQSYANKQTRKRIPPLVKEFREIVVLQGPSSLLPVDKLDSDWAIPLQFKQNPEVKVLPSGSRMLRVQNTGGQAGPSEGNELEKAALFDSSFDDTLEPDCEAVFGVPWSVDEFLERAASLVHPRNLHTGVPIELKDAIDWASWRSSCDMRNFRIGVIKEWLLLARDLNSAEKEIRLSLEPHVRTVLGQKRLKLFEHMLRQSGHGDVSLVDDIMKGFDIAGDIPKSAVFRKKFRPAELTVDSLRRNAKRVRSGILQSVHAEGDRLGSDHELAQAVYDATMKELSLGYLHGPYAESDLGPECSITRRFGVRQGQKVRPIDNYTESQLNQTTTVHETITLHTADVIAAASSYRLGLTDCADRRCLQGKSWDLKRAYKQLPLSKRALQDSYLAVLNPKSLEVELFGQYVLPFGSTASVNCFGRLSYALWRTAVVCLRIHWTVFFDDFLCVEEKALCEHTQWVVDTFFRLTGWEISEDKEFPFGSEMVTEEIDCVIKKGSLSANEALSLR